MRGRFVVMLGLALSGPPAAFGADPVVSAPAVENANVTSPTVVTPAQVVYEKPKPVEKPKLAEKPIPVEKPRPTIVKDVPPPKVQPSKPAESPAPAAVSAPAPVDIGTARPGEARAGYSFVCLGLAFAMLMIGMAAGFLWRHLMSRHKLGGMSVRIGTWRGIP